MVSPTGLHFGRLGDPWDSAGPGDHWFGLMLRRSLDITRVESWQPRTIYKSPPPCKYKFKSWGVPCSLAGPAECERDLIVDTVPVAFCALRRSARVVA